MLAAVIMLLCGLLTHFLLDLIRIKKEEGVTLNPKQYWMRHPYQTLLCIIGGVVGFIALNSAGELTAVTAYGVGYMANSVADKIGKRSLERL